MAASHQRRSVRDPHSVPAAVWPEGLARTLDRWPELRALLRSVTDPETRAICLALGSSARAGERFVSVGELDVELARRASQRG